MRRSLLPLCALLLAGCGSSEAPVTADEERMFKNPPPVDHRKIPANALEPKGPAFIGEPSKGSGASAPPGVGR